MSDADLKTEELTEVTDEVTPVVEKDTEDTEDTARLNKDDLEFRAEIISQPVIDSSTRIVQVGVSSETPVKREFGWEIMSHKSEDLNLDFLGSGRAPLLIDHDMNKQIGRVLSVSLNEDEPRQLRAKVQFGKSAQASEVFDDVVDGIRQNISVGYRIDGRVEQGEDDNSEEYRVKTSPMEISVVSIPADQSSLVGVGRAAAPLNNTNHQLEMENKMTDKIEQSPEVDTQAVREETAKQVRRDAKEIMELARRHNRADLGEAALAEGKTPDQFRGSLLEAIENSVLETPAHVVDLPAKEEKREYSLGRMIRSQMTNDWRDAGYERELDDEIARKVGTRASGCYVPDFAWSTRAGGMSTAATGAVGSENVSDSFVSTVHRGDMFVEALRAKAVLSDLGTTYMTGLTNRISMPKFSTGASAGFVEELGNVADQSQTDAAVTLTGKTLGAYADMSRLLIRESIPSIEQVVRDDILRSVADRIEYYAIQGSGSSGQPTGLLNASGVGNVDVSSGTDVDALTWADLVSIVKTVEAANGVVNSSALGWLSNPAVKAKISSTAKVGSSDSVMLMNDPWNSIYGYPAAFTSNVPSDLDPGDGGSDASAIIFGDFSQLLIGLFGAPSILVDETTGGLAGTVRVIIHQDVDVAVRNAASFAKSDEVSTA